MRARLIVIETSLHCRCDRKGPRQSMLSRACIQLQPSPEIPSGESPDEVESGLDRRCVA